MVEERIKFDEKELKPMSSWIGLFIGLILIVVFPVAIYFTVIKDIVFPTILGIICLLVGIFLLCGLKILNPNEAIVLVLLLVVLCGNKDAQPIVNSSGLD